MGSQQKCQPTPSERNPPRDKALSRAYLPLFPFNKVLLNFYFWGGVR